MHRQVKVALQHDEREEYDAHHGGEKELRLEPLLVLFSVEKDRVDNLVEQCLQQIVGDEAAGEDSHQVVLRLQEEGAAHHLKCIEEGYECQHQTCLPDEEQLYAQFAGCLCQRCCILAVSDEEEVFGLPDNKGETPRDGDERKDEASQDQSGDDVIVAHAVRLRVTGHTVSAALDISAQ